jgi:AraC-like DNA-binding protein
MLQPSTYSLDRMWAPLLRDLGVSSANILRRAGLPDDLFSQHNIRLDPEQFYKLWEGLETELNEPAFQVTICNAIKPQFFSPPLFAALCSPNFLTAIERIAHYKALVAPMRINITTSKDLITLELVWLPHAANPPNSFIAMELLFFVFLARAGTYEQIKPVRITTENPPRPATAFADYLGVTIQHGPGHQLSFAKTDALRPFLSASDDMWATFEPELRQRLSELNGSVSIEERVHAVVLEALPSGLMTIDDVSRRLAMSKRSLQRQLAAERTTFAAVLQSTREQLAMHYLTKSDLSILEIAFLLGFAEANSFYRAFRSWTGHTPDSVRKAALEAPDAVDV